MRKRIGEVTLGYEVRGSGPALVLLHAFPLDRRLWDETALALAEPVARPRRRVITFDFRGFGESELGGGYTLAELADDTARLLDSLGVAMAAVCGLSMGGYVALAFARRHAARLGRLILADTRAAADTPEAREARTAGIARVKSEGTAPFVAPMPARLLSPHAPKDTHARAHALMSAQSPDAIAHALAAMRDRPDRTNELATIRCPTLIMCGEDDAVTPPAESRALAAAIPGARYVELAAAGHLSNLDQPAAFTDALAQFLDDTH